jgi:hypothetical protein
MAVTVGAILLAWVLWSEDRQPPLPPAIPTESQKLS